MRVIKYKPQGTTSVYRLVQYTKQREISTVPLSWPVKKVNQQAPATQARPSSCIPNDGALLGPVSSSGEAKLYFLYSDIFFRQISFRSFFAIFHNPVDSSTLSLRYKTKPSVRSHRFRAFLCLFRGKATVGV